MALSDLDLVGEQRSGPIFPKIHRGFEPLIHSFFVNGIRPEFFLRQPALFLPSRLWPQFRSIFEKFLWSNVNWVLDLWRVAIPRLYVIKGRFGFGGKRRMNPQNCVALILVLWWLLIELQALENLFDIDDDGLKTLDCIWSCPVVSFVWRHIFRYLEWHV